MKKTKFIKFFVIALCLSLFWHSTYATEEKEPLVIILSDFDGTITQIAGNRWLTAAQITRIDNSKDLILYYAIEKNLSDKNLSIENLPYSIEITQEEDLFFRDILNRPDNSIPSYKVLELPPKSGLKGRDKKTFIVPGIYRLEYRDSFRDDEQLLKDYEKSKELAQNNGFSIKKLFHLGLPLINHNLTRSNSEIKIHTARGQSPEAFQKLLKKMQEDKVLVGEPELLDKISVHSFSRLNGSRYGDDFAKRKLELAKEELYILKPLLANDPSQEIHIVFAEDELGYIYLINEFFEKESKLPHLKKVYIHVLFTGPTEFLKDLDIQNNNRFVTYNNGILSPTSKEHAELVGLPLELIDKANKEMNLLNKATRQCRNVFNK